ncbi:LINE-1 retrotransposable element ORF2 protein [Vitis vinifera]|uniref:LINE-1 retrotransposable element ORF2 protein n=1 Tax=Vitis vinifera TaxID=29760 RepID=A0A438HB91_VITVI|nr:LINE-1 retrotransposable element ORF2 protein [Vitis vinifera]
MDRIKINRLRLTKESEIKEWVANAFQQQFSESSEWKADIGSLPFNQICLQEAETLELPFTEGEVQTTLMEMNGDKAAGPNGFSLFFWQRCWDFVKEEILEMFKEFHDQNMFLKSINNTFLVLIPKKGGAEDLGDFRPISLLGGLYKLLAKVLANRLKKVIGKVVSPYQNAFVTRRQILDASLIANEVIDAWNKRRDNGVICKLDIEKAYDTKFSVMVNGTPTGFFSSSKGLRQGDSLSPYLFVMGMEVLSVLIRRAMEGGFISGCKIQRGRGRAAHVAHLLFADDTIVFCEAKKEYLTNLSWILFWFEAASGLRINLAKSEIIPVGEVQGIEELAMELGCRVGQLPTVYLGLPLGVPNKVVYGWDGVEEKMRRRLALWKSQYISTGGRITLIKSTMVSMPVYQMSLFQMPISVARRLENCKETSCGEGVTWRGKLILLNGKCAGGKVWSRGSRLEDQKGCGCVWGGGVEGDLKEVGWCWDKMVFNVGKGNKIRFWTDMWCGDSALFQRFPHLYILVAHRNALVEDMWDQNVGEGGWNLRFIRDFNDWEVEMVGELLQALRGFRITWEEDSVSWKGGGSGQFRVKDAYSWLDRPMDVIFPKNKIWMERVLTKIMFFAWEATWGKILTLDRLQKRGWQLPNRCFLCACEAESVNHILIHCTVARVLWDLVLGLVGVKWVFLIL